MTRLQILFLAYFAGVGGVALVGAFGGFRFLRRRKPADPKVPTTGSDVKPSLPCDCPARHFVGFVCGCEVNGVRNPRGYGSRAVLS
jgi:hypothetical protein